MGFIQVDYLTKFKKNGKGKKGWGSLPQMIHAESAIVNWLLYYIFFGALYHFYPT